jgi:release factor glutamine methyltransferase
MASTDESYHALTTFIRNVGRYLRPNGRMLIFFGTSGDLGYLRRLLAEEGFRIDILSHRTKVKDGIRVDYYTHRVTRPTGL